MKENRDLMSIARESLRGKWSPSVGAAAIYFLITIATGGIPRAGWIISLILTGPLSLGLAIYFLAQARGQSPQTARIFEGFHRFGAALIAHLFISILVLLWCLLLIVPGIMAALAYSMTYFILADDRTIEPWPAMKASQELMRGRRWKLFYLFLRFTGWCLLSCLTLGIGFLWLIPYLQTSLALFYEDLKSGTGEVKAPPAPVPFQPM